MFNVTCYSFRLTAAQLLELDFFHEWSVHMTCTSTGTHDVLQFRMTDAVIRNRKEQKKENEEVQFHFNLVKDTPESVIQDLVRSISL